MVLGSIDALGAGFEGCEKKLEVDFEGADLRALPQSAWVSVLKKAQCSIITRAENDYFIAFVLSESSLFVFPHKVILKTCGTTSLLFGLPKLLEFAEVHGAVPNFVQFSRSNFMFPEQQPVPHKSFDSEVLYLNKFLRGQPYILGPLDGPRWNLYIADFDTSVNLSKDQTLEVIMFNLDPEKMKPFYRLAEEKDAETDEHLKHNGRTATEISGIDKLIAGAAIDSHLFSPCGYSCNGMKDEAYFTIHVTPEPECSFVSFETNVRMTSYTKLVRNVLATFSPAAFSVYLFVDNESVPRNSHSSLDWNFERFTRMGHTYHDFEGMYNLSVGNYTAQREPNRPQFGSVALHGVPKATLDTIEKLEAISTTHQHQDEAKFQHVPKALSDDDDGESSDDGDMSSCASQNPELDSNSSHRSVSPPSSPTAASRRRHSKNGGTFDAGGDHMSGGGDNVDDDGRIHTSSIAAAERLLRSTRRRHCCDSGVSSGASTPRSLSSLCDEQGRRLLLDYSTSRLLTFDDLSSVVLTAAREQCPVRSFDTTRRSDFGSVVSTIIDDTDIDKAFFVVDLSALVRRFREWSLAMPRVRPFYAVQCNSDPALLLAMNALGCGFSGPSIRHVDSLLSLGVEPSDILFSNPWPSISELKLARERDLGFFAFDNQLELQKIAVHCPDAQLFVIVTPPPVYGRHSATSRARARPAYGTSLTNAFRLLKQSKELGRAMVVGVMLSLHDDCPPEEVSAAIESVSPLFQRARRELGIDLQYLHLGSKGWDRQTSDADSLNSSRPLSIADTVTPALDDHFPLIHPTTGSSPINILAEPSTFMVESAYTVVVSLLSIRSEALPIEEEEEDEESLCSHHHHALSSKTNPRANYFNVGESSCSVITDPNPASTCSRTRSPSDVHEKSAALASPDEARSSSNFVDYKLYFDYYVDDGIYRSFPFLKRRRAQLVPHVVRRPVSPSSSVADPNRLEIYLPITALLPNPDTGAQVQSPSSRLVPSRSQSPPPVTGAVRIVDAHGTPLVTSTTQCLGSPLDTNKHESHRSGECTGETDAREYNGESDVSGECSSCETKRERLFQSRIWGATCDGLDSICDSVLLPQLHPDDRLYFRNMGANTFAHATAFNGFGGLPAPHYVVFK